ncbi:AAA family ATPase [Isoptericola croceus]|uniref:AAA family ATPase n=1 Tax=Isoptericola croceus TaxID=3031406 RepID=UPI0023F64B4B|nr:LuxR family transcriptional regulator [Isoptericola croceus]
MNLLGRRTERAVIEQLLADACVGRGGALVVRGEAGIGKTALLEHAAEAAQELGFHVQVSVGTETETQFAFAGVHQLCTLLLDHSGALPEPQRAALGVALGQHRGTAPDRFLVGLATLNLLAEAAEERPLLCLVDDAQWLDQASAQVLAFVARRAGAERLAVMLASRNTGGDDSSTLAGLPELRLERLADADARALLTAAVRSPLDDRVRDRIVAEARGNPLALLELPLSVPPARFAGGFERPDAADVPRWIEEAFRQRSTSLPAATQQLLLVAAVDPTGDVALLWRAAAQLQIARGAAAHAEAAGLMEIDTRVRFRHPLVRSAVYQAAAPRDRRRAHAALAVVTDVRTNPDRLAWHRAQAAAGPDEDVAAELESSAERARSRGGSAAAAAFLRRAAELSPDPDRRARRSLQAAHAALETGASETALELLLSAQGGPLDDLQRARLGLLRAQIAFHTTRGSEAPRMLLDAAETLGPLDADLSRDSYLHALEASFHAGRLGRGGELTHAARAAQTAPAPSQPARPVDLMLDGLATLFVQGYEASVPILQRALETLRAHASRLDDGSRHRLWLACHIAATLWDDEAIYELAALDVRLTRDEGALARLPAALNALASVLVLTGELARAAEMLAEERAITQATGAPPLPNARLILAAWRGRQTETAELHAVMVDEATGRGEGATLGLSDVALAALHNGLGNYEDALAAAERPVEHDELTFSSIALPELIEAAVRAGRPERASTALDVLSARARASGTEWALGLEARSRALLERGPAAEASYREATERLGRTRMATHLARAHLVYGEWLRGEGRRQDALEQLRTAHDLLMDMGVDAFAARAARELRATGEHPRERTAQPSDALTVQELHVARLVATGATSREVAAQLFLSPRTIEAHLRRIFRKLGITSRRQLREVRLP